MKKLIEANLYRSELIPISGKLVERYNECLKTLGFKPTKLKTFSIDGIGWSPEIAEEKKQIHYLNNGEANQHGIIITPLQNNKPIYTPFHTFDREIMKFVFRTHANRINDVTRDCAICLDFDQGIDAFYGPLDVLKYHNVTVKFRLINNLDKIQDQQLQLVEKFRRGNNFIDESIHQELLDSAKKHGDLRHRDLDLSELTYTTSSFYTEAFGGIYVLRDFITDIIIFKDIKWYKEAIKDTEYDVLMYHISQPELMEKLRDHLIIEADLEHIVKTERYDRIKKFEFVQQLEKPEHPIKEILDNKVLFKSYLNKLEINKLKKINGVEIYLERLERSNAYKIHDMVDQLFYFALHNPHSSLEPQHKDLIWKLLVNVSPKDVLFFYWYDKEKFYKTYETWNGSFKDWVIETISNNI